MSILQQWAITVAQTFEAFVGHASVPLGPLLYIVDLWKPSEIAHLSFYLVELTISDFILVRATMSIISFSLTPKYVDISPMDRMEPEVAGSHSSDLHIPGQHW